MEPDCAIFFWREAVYRIESSIQSLKPNQQRVVRLMIDDVPYKNMAVVIGCKENTVKTQICHTMKSLYNMSDYSNKSLTL